MFVRLRCDDVTRELAAPTPGLDASALTDHLASCPRCAAAAARDAEFTRLWDETRPEEPSKATWGAVWSRITERLDQPAAEVEVGVGAGSKSESELFPMTLARPWQRLGFAVFSLAQAAAIFLTVGLLAARPSPMVASTVRVAANFESGQGVFLIQWNHKGARIVAMNTGDTGPNSLDDNFTMFNAIEAMADDAPAE
jgi:hypothetical protein